MREIKFRGKRINSGEWVYGYLFKIWEQTYILWGTTNDVPNMIEVDQDTVGEYTGLKDRNGKDIYEGDVLERHSPYSNQTMYYKVEWDSENARFMSVAINGTLREMVSSSIERGSTVCGNIYENPSLLGDTGGDGG